jgi:hypothetical protein
MTPLAKHRKRKYYISLINEYDEKIKYKLKTKNLNGIFLLYMQKQFYINTLNKLNYIK